MKSSPASLPVTTGTSVTEAPRMLLGLQGFGIFHVFGIFALTIFITDIFPLALVMAILTYHFIRRYIDAKPRHHLRHWIAFTLIRKKTYRHRTPS